MTLSIHLPGNELSPLPEFDEVTHDDNAGLTFPQPVLTKSRSEPMLTQPSKSFTIPRKPVPSYTFSIDGSRSSMDSRYTLNTFPSMPQSAATSQPPTTRRPSIASTSQSTRDFLDALDTRLPQSPPLLRSKSGPEPVYTLYRRASEQSLRLRTHLEERERVTAWCDTILEDNKEGADGERKVPTPIETKPQLSSQSSTEWFWTPLSSPPTQGPNHCSDKASATPIEETSIPHRPRAASTRTRISQWLLRSTPAVPSTNNPPFYSLRPSFSTRRTRRRPSLSSSSIYSTASTAVRSSPPHRKASSLSSSVTMHTTTVVGVEKLPVEIREVGIAM